MSAALVLAFSVGQRVFSQHEGHDMPGMHMPKARAKQKPTPKLVRRNKRAATKKHRLVKKINMTAMQGMNMSATQPTASTPASQPSPTPPEHMPGMNMPATQPTTSTPASQPSPTPPEQMPGMNMPATQPTTSTPASQPSPTPPEQMP